MQRRLKWNAIGLEPKTKKILEIMLIEKDEVPEDNLKDYRKIQRFVDELEYLVKTLTEIREELIPSIEKFFRLEFPTPELIYLAMSRPGIKKIFEDLHIFFDRIGNSVFNNDEFKDLSSCGDAGDVLALIGDSAIDLAVVETLWDSSLSTTGELTIKRGKIVRNKNLAIICDRMNIYDYRLKKLLDNSSQNSKTSTINHEKGTLIEALYGVIYLEFGFEEILRTVPLLQ